MDKYYEDFLRKVKSLAAKKGVDLPDDDSLIVMNNDGFTASQIVRTQQI